MERLNRPQVFLPCFLATAILFLVEFVVAQDGNLTHFRICVPEVKYTQCQGMVADGHTKNGKIVCVYGTDKMACIDKMAKDEADFMPIDPEEVYVAHRYKQNGFAILSEIRSQEFATRDFQYEPVAVMRKSSGIKSISDLKGKRSCHTGFGRNAGWKVPFSHLMDKGQLQKLCEELDAPTPEKDLNAVAEYFSAACAPGAWVPEKDTDQKLKERYSKLCQLCQNPQTCAKDDVYASYDGALKCLTANGGDVAWTKLDAVEKFFKLKDSHPLEISGEYAFLCWDGSSVPLTTHNPCSWAKRPWKAIMTTNQIAANHDKVKELQEQISIFQTIAIDSGRVTNAIPPWFKDVLEYDKETNVVVHNEAFKVKTITPAIYLSKKNFTVTIEKASCATNKKIRICLRSELEKQKCNRFGLAALGKRILPRFECVLGEDSADCAQKVAKGDADVVILSAKEADRAKKDLHLVSILSELEETDVIQRDQMGPYRYAVAVITSKISSEFRGNISSLRGKRSCHGSIRSIAGWNAPIDVLRSTGQLSGPTCGLTIEMSKYFNNESCVPGALDPDLKMPWLPKSLCSLCAGDGPAPGKAETPTTFCDDSNSERYYGDLGALRCLEDGIADVAFLDHVGLHLKTIGVSSLSLDKMRLLCPNGTVADLKQFPNCNWGRVASQKILARGGDENLVTREDARLSLLKAQDIFRPGSKGEFVLRLFGPYYGNKDFMFQDTSVGLCDEPEEEERKAEDKLIRDFDYCTTSAGIRQEINKSVSLFIVMVAAVVFLKF